MPENVVTSSTLNFERMSRPQTRSRGSATPPKTRKPTDREIKIKRAIEPEKLMLRISTSLVEQYQSWYEYGATIELALALDRRGIVRQKYVHDEAFRLGVIMNAIEALIRDGRLLTHVESRDDRFVTTIWLTDDERSFCMLELAKRLDKRNMKRLEDGAREAQPRDETDGPIPINRRQRRRELQRQNEVKSAKRQSARRTA